MKVADFLRSLKLVSRQRQRCGRRKSLSASRVQLACEFLDVRFGVVFLRRLHRFSLKMFAGFLLLTLSMASAFVLEAAASLASTAEESAPQDLGVTKTDVQQYQPEAARVASYGLLRGEKHISSLRPAALLVLSIAAAVAMIFMLLRCFRALQQADNAAPASRRLAEGGPESSASCPVSRDYSLSTIMTAVAICAMPRIFLGLLSEPLRKSYACIAAGRYARLYLVSSRL